MSPSLTNLPIETPPRPPSPVHGFGTLAVHAGSPHDPVTGAVIAPVGTPLTSSVTKRKKKS
jgi:cystathionine gamma-lyase